MNVPESGKDCGEGRAQLADLCMAQKSVGVVWTVWQQQKWYT